MAPELLRRRTWGSAVALEPVAPSCRVSCGGLGGGLGAVEAAAEAAAGSASRLPQRERSATHKSDVAAAVVRPSVSAPSPAILPPPAPSPSCGFPDANIDARIVVAASTRLSLHHHICSRARARASWSSKAQRVQVEQVLPPTPYPLPPTPYHRPPTPPPTHYHLPPTSRHLPTTPYSLPTTTYHLLPTSYPPTPYHLLPTTYHLPPTTYTYHLPPTTCHLPTPPRCSLLLAITRR